MTTPFRRRTAALAAAVLGLTLLGGATAPAANAASAADIDPDATAALHVHKFVQPDESGAPADGLPKDTTGLTPLAGVEFTVQRVSGIDLTTNEGWRAAGELTAAEAAARAEQPGTAKTTDAAGDASFPGLPLGLYLVSETSVPAGVTPGTPFLVTLPLTDPEDRDAWLYDVHVYPKNAVTGGEKTVRDAGAVAQGDEIVYTIRGDIPNVEVIDGYRIVDALDPRLDHLSTAVSLTNGVPVAEGRDARVSFDQAGNTVTVEFTEQGRALLAANATAAQVQLVITARANATGVIPNEAVIYPNEASFDVQPGEPGGPVVTPPVETKWGALVIEKVDLENPATKLEGAVFQVFRSEADARALREPLEIDGATQFTTGRDGRVVISGLRYSDFADGRQLQPGDPDWRSYWVAEVQAPKGYELLAEPVKVDVTSDDPSRVTVTIENVPHNGGFMLPSTGLAGTVALLAGGALLLAGVLVLAVLRRRHSRREA